MLNPPTFAPQRGPAVAAALLRLLLRLVLRASVIGAVGAGRVCPDSSQVWPARAPALARWCWAPAFAPGRCPKPAESALLGFGAFATWLLRRLRAGHAVEHQHQRRKRAERHHDGAHRFTVFLKHRVGLVPRPASFAAELAARIGTGSSMIVLPHIRETIPRKSPCSTRDGLTRRAVGQTRSGVGLDQFLGAAPRGVAVLGEDIAIAVAMMHRDPLCGRPRCSAALEIGVAHVEECVRRSVPPACTRCATNNAKDLSASFFVVSASGMEAPRMKRNKAVTADLSPRGRNRDTAFVANLSPQFGYGEYVRCGPRKMFGGMAGT